MNLSLTLESLTAIDQSSDVQVLKRHCLSFAHELQYDFFNLAVVKDSPGSPMVWNQVSNAPAEWIEFDVPHKARQDPVNQKLKVSGIPFLWDEAFFVAAGALALYEEQSAVGFNEGVTVALHLPNDEHLIVGIDRRKPISREPEHLVATFAALQLLAVYVQGAAFRLLTPANPDVGAQGCPAGPGLTARELEALRWTMAGKTAWEAGRLMSISERTAVQHIASASRKLDCINKLQAVIKSMRLGLL